MAAPDHAASSGKTGFIQHPHWCGVISSNRVQSESNPVTLKSASRGKCNSICLISLVFLSLPTNRGPVHVLSLFAALWLPDLATVWKIRTPTASLAVPSTCLSIWPLCIFAPGSFKTGWVISLCPLFFLIQGFCTMSHVLQTTSALLRNWMYWAQCDSQQLSFHLTSISQLCLYFSA